MSVRNAYPLSWPVHFPRTRLRARSKFKVTLAAALENVNRSLRLFAKDSGKQVSGLVISSNYSLGSERPTDPAVAVYFEWDTLAVCIPVDRYDSIAANLQAIHHIVEARRVELRHGSLALIRASLTGFAALPPPSGSVRSWREVLGVPHGLADLGAVETAYRTKARAAHPDRGGSDDAMAALNSAIEQARRELTP